MGARRAAFVTFLVACKGASSPPPAPQPAAPAPPAVVTAEPAATPAPAQPAVPSTKMTLAEVGLEATSLDRTVDPCVDFYQFACGGWLAANQIPADRARWSRGFEMIEK